MVFYGLQTFHECVLSYLPVGVFYNPSDPESALLLKGYQDGLPTYSMFGFPVGYGIYRKIKS